MGTTTSKWSITTIRCNDIWWICKIICNRKNCNL